MRRMTTAHSCLFFGHRKSGERSWRSFFAINVQEELLEFSAFQLEGNVSAGDDYQSRPLLHAYHEAGHALVSHVMGRCIEEVSIVVRYDGYGGYCRFNAFIEDANDHPEWRDDVGNPDLVTIYYAGMLATAYACAPYVTYDEEERSVAYPEGSERDDLEQIHIIHTQIGIDEQQRKTITDASWTRAQTILSEYWPAVDALATALLKRERLGGRAAHRLIWQTIGYPETDWRFQELSIKPRRA